MSDLRNQVEALLFSSGRAMDINQIVEIIGSEKRSIKKALSELKEFYDSLGSSLMVTQEGDSWKLNIREKYIALVIKIISDTELTKTVLETLSIIAWKSPVLQSDVIKIRGTNAYDHIKELVDGGFINKEKDGRSYKLRISEKFYEYFDVPGDKGIKAAFQDIRMPEKKETQRLGDLDIVSVDNNSHEHGKTTEIFGDEAISLSQDSQDVDENNFEDLKNKIPPVDEGFLDKVNTQIENISKKNDDLDNDELFKRKAVENESDISENDALSQELSDEKDGVKTTSDDMDKNEDVAS